MRLMVVLSIVTTASQHLSILLCFVSLEPWQFAVPVPAVTNGKHACGKYMVPKYDVELQWMPVFRLQTIVFEC